MSNSVDGTNSTIYGVDGQHTGGNYSVPAETLKVFDKGILKNPLIAKHLTAEAIAQSKKIQFTGSDKPSVPVVWRFAESSAAIKALEASLLGALLERKYNVEMGEVEINTDHAMAFIMSLLYWTINPDSTDPITPADRDRLGPYIKNCDLHRMQSSFHRQSATNIYKTCDNRFFHLHGDMNPDKALESIGLPHDIEQPSRQASWVPFIENIGNLESDELQRRASEVYKISGQTCMSVSEYRASEQGKANADAGLFEVHHVPSATQKPSWWPSSSKTSAARPLAGLKVVDLTRVIASPSCTRGLAELGASVMRVTSPNVTDYSFLHLDLNWGKWCTELDLKQNQDREKLAELIKDADVVVQGYRPGVFEKFGFGQNGVLEMCKDRERGIIYVNINCYGWHGPWKGRSGWQQISDATCGMSVEFGRAMGLEGGEAVTPCLPNADYLAGVAGVCGVLSALMRRAEEGGSFTVDTALNYYSSWLADHVGTYPEDIWEEVWNRNGRFVFRSTDNVLHTMPTMALLVRTHSRATILNSKFFEDRENRALGVTMRVIKPVIQFKTGTVALGYNVGTRGNGVDQPYWPDDLSVEIVK